MSVRRICWYFKGTNDKGLSFNESKKMVVNFYVDEDFMGLWGNENPQDSICAGSRTGFVVTFANFPLLWVSKLDTDIYISTLHSEYVAFSRSIISLLPLKRLSME